jgi:hypothetical protein
MSVILSCGHREDDFDKHYSIMTKDWSRENTKAVGYRTVCAVCYKMYEAEGLLLYTDDEAMEWIKG